MKRPMIALVMIICLGLTVVYFAVSKTNAVADTSNQDRTQLVLEGCRQAVASVKTGKGPIVVEKNVRKSDGGLLFTKTTYDLLFTGEHFKLSSRTECLANSVPKGQNAEFAVKPGEINEYCLAYDHTKITKLLPILNEGIVSNASYPTGKQEIVAYEDELASPLYGLVDIGTLSKRLSSDGLFTLDAPPLIVGSETLDGDECMIVEFTLSRHSKDDTVLAEIWRFWVNPYKGYSVPLVRKWKQGGIYSKKILVEEIKTNLKESNTDIWVPTKIVHDSYRLDTQTREPYLKQAKTITYGSNFCFNVPVSEEDLNLNLRSGTKVYDELLDAEYTVP